MRSSIETNYPANRKVSVYRTGGTVLRDLFSSLVGNKLEARDIACGHIPVVFHNYTERHCDHFIFLRDLVDHALSFYELVKHGFPGRKLHNAFKFLAII